MGDPQASAFLMPVPSPDKWGEFHQEGHPKKKIKYVDYIKKTTTAVEYFHSEKKDCECGQLLCRNHSAKKIPHECGLVQIP